jgi:hypothetical protein
VGKIKAKETESVAPLQKIILSGSPGPKDIRRSNLRSGRKGESREMMRVSRRYGPLTRHHRCRKNDRGQKGLLGGPRERQNQSGEEHGTFQVKGLAVKTIPRMERI